MDLTIEVMLPPRGAVDFSASANPKYRVLSPVAVYERKTVDEVTMPCTGYIHVNGVPGDYSLVELNAKLCAPYADGNERRIWALDSTIIPGVIRANLLQDRQVTMTWAQFRVFMQNRRENRGLDQGDL
jgi:hypothetical protein